MKSKTALNAPSRTLFCSFVDLHLVVAVAAPLLVLLTLTQLYIQNFHNRISCNCCNSSSVNGTISAMTMASHIVFATAPAPTAGFSAAFAFAILHYLGHQ